MLFSMAIKNFVLLKYKATKYWIELLTPAMEVGMTKKLWNIEDLVNMLEG